MNSTEPTSSDDPRTHLAAAVAETGRLIAGVEPTQLHDPTPCDAFDVELLLAHLDTVLRRIAGAGRGEPPATWPSDEIRSGPDGWADLWSDNTKVAIDAWSDASVLTRPTAVPWGSFPGAEVAGVYTSELAVHGWDLARATGQEPGYDDATVDAGFSVFRGQMPAEGRQEILDFVASISPEGTDGPFHLAEDAPDDAPLLDQLAAWSGRDPAWQPPT